MPPTARSAPNHSIQQIKKVLNHNHLTEEYRRPAHNTCNLNYHIHAFLFNIKNYLCELRNIQWREAELNVNLPRVNNSDIKQNGMEAVIQVACVVSWTSTFFCQMTVVVDFFISWLEWFSTDRIVGGIVVFSPLFLGQPFHRNFIGQVLSPDGCCG